jgi:signal transduction histidine kinase
MLGELPPLVEETLYRIAQEALNNVVKHSEASLVTVRLKRLPGEVELEVKDNGVGFKSGRGLGLGLTSMKERAERMEGSFNIYSRQGGGAEISARLPLK